MKKTFIYTGISFKQNKKAPELFAFVAPAEDLVDFCGVARKSEKILTNYQRALDEDRVLTEVTPFFRIAENCTPTAVVISLHETPLAELKFEDLGGGGDGLNLKKLVLTLTDPKSLTDDEVIEEAKKLLDARLATETTPTLPETPADASQNSSIEDQEEDEAPEDETDSEIEESSDQTEEVEIGTSMLRDLRSQLDDQSQAKLIVETLRDMLKPALIIDGQHRTFGAAKLEEKLPLLVCSLVKPDWKEQVFQFTVINDKAQGIPKPFITSLAGMSLTSNELNELQTRLSQAGVQLWEVEVMQRLGYDPRSPYFNRIEFKTTGSGTSGLGYQTMKQLGRAWFEPKAPGLVAVYRALYEGEKKSSKKSLVSQWQKSEDWFKYFCIFWDQIKEKYGTSPLWETHSSLMTAVVLLQLQQSFLRGLGNLVSLTIEKIEEPDPEKRALLVEQQFRDIAKQWTSRFTQKHFPEQWGLKSLNHKDGKSKLLDYFDKVALGASVKNHAILTGK
ncbi:MAG: hypothetical protein QM742_09385 [Aquabacterium sp.]